MDVEKSIFELIVAVGVNPCRSLTGLCIDLHLSAGSWTVSELSTFVDLQSGVADDRQTFLHVDPDSRKLWVDGWKSGTAKWQKGHS